MMPPWLDAVVDAILPPRPDVVLARTLTKEALRKKLRPRLTHEPWLLAFFEYQDPSVRALIRAVKFYGDTKTLPALGEVTSDFLMDMISDRREMAGWNTPLLVPMPASKKRLRERGYNQVERIGKALMPFLGEAVIYAPNALVRQDRESQVRIPREERAKNISGAFFVPNTEAVSGKQIILLDDVVETGSTMKDARRALLAAGASEILGIAIAH
jgi:ComF family protein